LSSKYSESGVDIDASEEVNRRIANVVSATWGREVLSEVGNFGGLFELKGEVKDPVLVSSMDGVGTKLKVAFMSGRHHTVGEDLVNHCVNDILVQGAEPLFFLDYFACGKLKPEVVASVIEGLSRGCTNNGCALIGGETAEMPGFYPDGEYDLAGSIVGIVERGKIIDGQRINPGDVVWAFPSGGLHTNGYSLARKIIFQDQGLKINDTIHEVGRKVVDILLDVHRSYLPEVKSLREIVDIKGLVHITGGGIVDNIPRVLPSGCNVVINGGSWEIPPFFRYLEEKGMVSVEEMYRVFNMGLGMVVFLSEQESEKLGDGDYRWDPIRVGTVVKGRGEVVIR
jgi:phosphoribosylformylglycinamidine cyclo-ligase